MNEIPALGQQTDAILGELGFDRGNNRELAAGQSVI